MVVCSVYGCKSTTQKKNKDNYVVFHSIPNDRKCAGLWWDFCKRKDRKMKSFDRICSIHFKPSDYERDLKHELLNLPLRKILKRPAHPSLNKPGLSIANKENLEEPRSDNPESIKTIKAKGSTWSSIEENLLNLSHGILHGPKSKNFSKKLDRGARLKRRKENVYLENILNAKKRHDAHLKAKSLSIVPKRSDESSSIDDDAEKKHDPLLEAKSLSIVPKRSDEPNSIKDEKFVLTAEVEFETEEEELSYPEIPEYATILTDCISEPVLLKNDDETIDVKIEKIPEELDLERSSPNNLPLTSTPTIEELSDTTNLPDSNKQSTGKPSAQSSSNQPTESPPRPRVTTTTAESTHAPNVRKKIQTCDHCKHYKRIMSQLNFYKRKCRELKRNPELISKLPFSKAQTRRLLKKKMVRWSPEDISKGIGLYAISGKAYKFVRDVYGIPLPCKSTLTHSAKPSQAKTSPS